MDKLVLHPTDTAQWQALLNEAQVARHCMLTEDIESYLVFLLMRFASRPELANSILAIDFLSSHADSSQTSCEKMQDIGDKSLLFSGLFPGLAEKRCVNVGYFIDIGKTAYANVSNYSTANVTELFAELSQDFVLMMEVLQATRDISTLTWQEQLDQWVITAREGKIQH